MKILLLPSQVRALDVGKAAEHLVCADLLLDGYKSFLADQGCPYDVVVDIKGRLLRVQVKACAVARATPQRAKGTLSYMFSIRRAGRGRKRIIRDDEFDLLALVALDIRRVAYIPLGPKVLQCIHLKPPGSDLSHPLRTRGDMDDYPFEAALMAVLR